MKQAISFPGLGIGEIVLDRVAFTLFGRDIYWYGILIAAAFLAAILYILKRCPQTGIDPDRAMDVLLGSIVGGIVGARAYYVIFSWGSYKDNLPDIFKLWEGGLAVYGGIIGGFLVGYLMCRARKVPFLPMADATAGGIILGQAIGRWGNFINVEAFGSNTSLPWGMAGQTIESYLSRHQAELAAQGIIVDPSMPVHPTFFYESMWCLLGFLFLVWYLGRRRFDGEVVLLYFAWYGAGRSVIEGLRTDSLMLGSFRVSQMLAILLVAVSVGLIICQRAHFKKVGKPVTERLYVHYSADGRANQAKNPFSKKTNLTGNPETAGSEAASEGQPGTDKEGNAYGGKAD